MKKVIIAVSGAIVVIGVVIMTSLIFSGKTDASPFDYRANVNYDQIL